MHGCLVDDQPVNVDRRHILEGVREELLCACAEVIAHGELPGVLARHIGEEVQHRAVPRHSTVTAPGQAGQAGQVNDIENYEGDVNCISVSLTENGILF
jgi:hypothetical protein